MTENNKQMYECACLCVFVPMCVEARGQPWVLFQEKEAIKGSRLVKLDAAVKSPL